VPIYGLEFSARDWTMGVQNNRITAQWGYSVAVPSDIAFAATVFVAGIINYRNEPSAKQSEKIGNYAVTYGEGSSSWADYQSAMAILNKYAKICL
jgi:hypothetical protein